MALTASKYEMTGLGQFGSIFTSGVTALVPPTDFIIAAVQFIEEGTFTALTVENVGVGSRVYPNTANTAHASGTFSEGTGGLAVDGTAFPAGVTIFGRWTGLKLATGVVIAYLAPKH